MDVNLKLVAKQGEQLVEPGIYRQIVGILHYLTITRPDISFAVQQLSQFQNNPYSEHLAVVMSTFVPLLSYPHKRHFTLIVCVSR
ncbi:Retrovirus-related Pol polyprotein from transposon RE1 [Linum grandiflorum]